MLVFCIFQCDMAVGTRLFFDMMNDDIPKVLLFGHAWPEVTSAIAESSPQWNISQVNASLILRLCVPCCKFM